MIPAAARQLLLRRIVDDLHQAGKLKAIGPVADTPGLIATLDRSIAELKRSAAQPEDLAKVISRTGRDEGKILDLLEVYRRYQEYMQAHRLYDVEGQMWQAREELARLGGSAPPGLADLEAIAVDGFLDFTPNQLRILAMLWRLGRTTLITLPLGEDCRTRLWQWTGQTLDRIRAAFDGKVTTVSLPAPADSAPLLANVFDLTAKPVGPPANLRVIAAAGVEAEVAAVARRVKRLLVDGAAAGTIAVLARSMDEYRPTVERIFADHDIPIAAVASPLVDSPPVRFLLGVAAVAPEFHFRQVLWAIRNSYFRAAALGAFDERTVAAAEAIIRDGNVLEGRQAYAQAAERLLQQAARKAAASGDGDASQRALLLTPQMVQPALAMLAKLFDLAEAARGGDLMGLADALELEQTILGRAGTGTEPLRAATGREWSDRQPAPCRSRLACGANLIERASTIARDLRALAVLEQSLENIGKLDRAGGEAWRPDAPQLSQALAAVNVPPARGESLVDVLDVLEARASRYEHVFVLGVGEGSFPRKFVESSLVGEAQRQAWREGGIELDRRSDVTAREMLLFYLAISRSAESLTLAYQASDAAGKAAAPSTFLLSLLEGVGGAEALEKSGAVEHVGAGQFLPPPDQIATRRDAFNSAIADVLGSTSAKFTTPKSDAAFWEAMPVAQAAGAMWARHQRWQSGPCDAFDGRLSAADLLGELSRRFSGEAVFSASQFGSYGQCPWRFFARYVLQLEPLLEPQRVLEAVDAGTFCHDVLFDVFTSLKGDSQAPLLPRRRGRAQDTRRPRRRHRRAEPARRATPAPLPRPVANPARPDAHRAAGIPAPPAQPAAAGRRTALRAEFRPAAQSRRTPRFRQPHESIRLQAPGGEFCLYGRIDRVDHAEFGGLAGALVVDYKTGRPPTDADMEAGRNVQLPLYAAAAEQLLGQASLGGAFHHVGEEPAMKFFAMMKLRGREYLPCQNHTERRAAVMAKVGEFLQGMRSGRFDLLPTGRKCPSWCEYKRICHFSRAGWRSRRRPRRPGHER